MFGRTGIIGIMSAAVIAVVGAGGNAARANTVTTVNIVGTNGGEPVNGTAVFTFGAGSLTIDLTNNVTDPHAAASLFGGIKFTISGGGAASGLTASGTLIDIGSGGTISAPTSAELASLSSTDNWGLTGTANYNLEVSGNDPLIVGNPNGGTGAYSNANSSLTNGSHDPFLEHTAHFTMTIAGLSATDNVSNVSSYWGTTFKTFDSTDGTETVTTALVSVPLPDAACMGVSLLGTLGLANMVRRKVAR